MNRQRSFITFLMQIFFVLFLFLFTILLGWIYLSTGQAIRQQQDLSIELNNANSARVLDHTLQLLLDELEQTATRLTSITSLADSALLRKEVAFSPAMSAANRDTSLDLLRFFNANQQQVAVGDSAFFDLSGVEEKITGHSDLYLNRTRLLSFKTGKNKLLWLIVSGMRVVHKESGRVLGVLIGGVVLNDDTPLAREIGLRSNAQYAALQVGTDLLCSNKYLPETLRDAIRGIDGDRLRTSLNLDNKVQNIVISRSSYPLGGETSLFMVHVYQDTLQTQLRRTLLFSGSWFFLVTFFLFLLTYAGFRSQVFRAIRALLSFTEQAASSAAQPAFISGTFSEFNRIGRAGEKMLIQLDESRQALISEQALLVSMINAIPDLIFYKNEAGVYLGCNKAFEVFTGRAQEDIVGKTDLDLFPPEQADLFLSMDRTMLYAGEARRNEEWVTYPDGYQVLLDTVKTPFTDAAGRMLGLIGVSRDITGIKAIEATLAAERERLQVTLRSIGDAVITTDTEGKIVFLNKVAESLTGWTNEEARGRLSGEVLQLVNEGTGESCVDPVQKVIESGRIVNLAKDTTLIARDGCRRSIADSGAPIRNNESKMSGVVIVFRDITLEKKMTEELLNVKKLQSIGILAGGIAHDFNNILAAILGNIELAERKIAGRDEQVSELLNSALKAGSRATKLTKQLLTFSKGGDPVKERTSLPDLIRDSAVFVLHGSSVIPEFLFAEDLWEVDVDSGQISQVIQNIIINAKQAMPAGGKVKINCDNIDDPVAEPSLSVGEGRFVRIVIADTGVGIPPEITDKIFDPYFSTKQTGSGLGLAICHSIIRKHEGHIAVHSRLGEGTTFTLYLPAGAVDGKPAEKQPERESSVAAVRVMVMDDEEMLREMTACQLEILGHETILVADGNQAIRRYQEQRDNGQPVDLVIMDLTIPGGMGGQEAAAELIRIDPDARIIVASGYSTDPVMAQYQDFGFRAAIEKPVDIASLSQAIAKALR